MAGANLLPVQAKAAEPGTEAKLPRLKVHADGHLLQGEDGSPFFWLADTAWQLLHALTWEESQYYLAERARQGFTVTQVVVLCETHGIHEPSAMGLTPFDPVDSMTPNERYFDHLVRVVDFAATQGIYVALLPAWGDKLTAPWGEGPRMFRADNLPVARRYAAYVAGKLRGRTNVLWTLGGDRPARVTAATSAGMRARVVKAGFSAEVDWRPIWEEFVEGIRSGSDRSPFFLYHPQAGTESTSVVLAGATWLAVNGMQSGHGDGHDLPVWEWVKRDVGVRPAKPTVDLEPNYEDHPVSPWPRWNPANGYFRDDDVRRQVYRAVFAGACGTTYGHHAVWQFASERDELINHADMDWRTAMQRPGGRQMIYLRELMLSRPYFGRREAPEMLPGQTGEEAHGLHAVATRGAEGRYAMVFFPQARQALEVEFGMVRGVVRRAWWFDPRTGGSMATAMPATGTRGVFRSPMGGADAVLVIDGAAEGFGPPGVRSRS